VLRCDACGQDNPDHARFCLDCGASLTAVRPPREERRVVTAIFVDLVGFTAHAEKLDPEDVRAILRPYHDRVRAEIESFGGVVEKFIGDAVMGIFGAPVAHGDDAERAVRAALVVRDMLAAGDLRIRIAVNTGEAFVVLDARPALGESMVAGDVINTASRLQSAAPVDAIIVGEETYLATRDAIEYEPAAPVVAKGKEQALPAWIAVRATTAAGERVPALTSIVGRSNELDLLHAVWRRVADERLPHLVSILGPAGVGKSTLTREFASAAAASGARVVRGRALPYRESSAYGAFASQVMGLCEVFESDAADVVLHKLHERAATLLTDVDAAAVAGHLAVLLGIEGGHDPADRKALFFSSRCFVEAVAREQPTVLIFEDVHWADGNLLDLVEELAAGLHGLPVLLVTLARPELIDSRPGWGAGLPSYMSLRLEPLNANEAHELALRRLDDPERAADVVRVAEGNPLFIEQLAAVIDTTTGSLPTTVREIVAARLDALPREERSLLVDAAVVGRVFWRGALEGMDADADADDLDEILAVLERRDLIRRDATSMIEGQHQFAFTHVVIRDVAYGLLPRSDRARRHAQAAEFFEGATGASGEAVGALAHHWRDAGNHERAIDQLVRAAEQSERGWAKDRAVLLYREALELVPSENTERRSALRRRLAIASTAEFHLSDVRRPESRPA
jgi:class 3 adenylate cyclase